MVTSDAAVIGRIRAGDHDAFAILVRRYQGRCARLANRLLGDPDEAADAVQDAFIRAFAALDRYEEQERFGAWLLCIVANRCRSARTRARRHAALGGTWQMLQDGAVDPVLPDPALASRLDGALRQLPPATRTVILRKHAVGETYEELARDTGMGVSALKMRVARGTTQLRHALVAAGVTAAAAAIMITAHRPGGVDHRPAAAVACDTLRALVHDTLPTERRDSLDAIAPACPVDSTRADSADRVRRTHAPRPVGIF